MTRLTRLSRPTQKQASTVSAAVNPRTWEILQLIADYQRAARATVAELQRQTRTRDLLRAWHKGTIDRTGKLKQPKGRYQFHGGGCRFEIGDRTIEVDFGPAGRCDGFDAWRLEQYAASAFEWHRLTPGDIAAGLRELESLQLIAKPQWTPGAHLHYFTEDIETPARTTRATSKKSHV